MVAVLIAFGSAALYRKSAAPAGDPAVCAGPPLRSVEAREEAMIKGYDIDRRYDCISKVSYAQVAEAEAKWQAAHAERANTAVAKARHQEQRGSPLTLARARASSRTRVAVAPEPTPLPHPPAELYVRSDYINALGDSLPAFITPDPRDGKKHPAIIWLTGGDSATLGNFWTEGTSANDQSAQAFRKAGVVMLFPTLRGGNENARPKEYFYGEVDDVIAAAEHLAQQSWVDARQIYLGGHSTGGTLALLVAESSDRFAAVFAFGPVADAANYSGSIMPVHLDGQERRLRSPVYWLGDLARPTFVIEGDGRGNIGELYRLCAAPPPAMHCLPVAGHDHFSVLAPVTRVIAGRIVMTAGSELHLQASDLAADLGTQTLSPR